MLAVNQSASADQHISEITDINVIGFNGHIIGDENASLPEYYTRVREWTKLIDHGQPK